ncbi:hypothetical protein BDZ91DRAFT_846610 [Kalaharituber pfeilii]|nr:hypothetical protein BDZ91DRAFT_846610 [Kalaharituber pfeilii]
MYQIRYELQKQKYAVQPSARNWSPCLSIPLHKDVMRDSISYIQWEVAILEDFEMEGEFLFMWRGLGRILRNNKHCPASGEVWEYSPESE